MLFRLLTLSVIEPLESSQRWIRLGYVGIVNRNQEILVLHISKVLPGLKSCISAVLVTASKEHAMGDHGVKDFGAAHQKLLPGLKSHISAELVTAAKEHASYGEIMESKITLRFTRHWPEVLGSLLSYYYQLLSPGRLVWVLSF